MQCSAVRCSVVQCSAVQVTMQLKEPQKWLQRPAGANFGFGSPWSMSLLPVLFLVLLVLVLLLLVLLVLVLLVLVLLVLVLLRLLLLLLVLLVLLIIPSFLAQAGPVPVHGGDGARPGVRLGQAGGLEGWRRGPIQTVQTWELCAYQQLKTLTSVTFQI